MKIPINGSKLTLKGTNSKLMVGDPNLTDTPTLSLTVNSTAGSPTSGTNITASITNNDASAVSVTDLGGTIASKGDFGLTIGQAIASGATITDNTIAATPGQEETFSARVIAAGENRSTPVTITLPVAETPLVSLSSVGINDITFSFTNVPAGSVVYATVNGEQKSRTGEGTITWTGLSGSTTYSTSNVYVITTGAIPSATVAVNPSGTTGKETTVTPTVTLTVDTDINDHTTGTLATVAITNNDPVGGVINILDPGGSNLGKINLRNGFDLVDGQSINAGQTLTDTGIQLALGGDSRFRASVTATNKNVSAALTRTIMNASSPGTITLSSRTATAMTFSFPTIPSNGKLWAELRLGTLSSGTLVERKSISGPGPQSLTWTGLSGSTQYTVRAYNLSPDRSRSSTNSLTESTDQLTLSSPFFTSSSLTAVGGSSYNLSTQVNNPNNVSVTGHFTLWGTNYAGVEGGTFSVPANSTYTFSRPSFQYPGARLEVFFSRTLYYNSMTSVLQIGNFTSSTT
jgi:hypothetical protein